MTMRLEILKSGHRPIQRLQFALVKMLTGSPVIPGPMAVTSYRREWFGKSYAALVQRVMRGAREWTVGEVELFAAFVSSLNRCRF
jgi:hypothetical protein